jgi:cyanophycinase-like exopeptidase
MTRRHGSLVVIGGHEDTNGDKIIPREVARRAGTDGKVVVVTIGAASRRSTGRSTSESSAGSACRMSVTSTSARERRRRQSASGASSTAPRWCSSPAEIGRLLGAIAHNARVLGIGIDENTAAIFQGA